MTYDSTQDTHEHIARVRQLLAGVIADFHNRKADHDASKLQDPEKSYFDEWTPRLKELTYGSDEYRDALRAMSPALDHHYAENDHHPEHFADGVSGMNLLQVLEMLADWKAASERHADGDLMRSILFNAGRFDYGQEITNLLVNTAKYMDWL